MVLPLNCDSQVKAVVLFLVPSYERVDEIIWVKTNQLQRIIRTGRTGHWLNHGKEHCLVSGGGLQFSTWSKRRNHFRLMRKSSNAGIRKVIHSLWQAGWCQRKSPRLQPGSGLWCDRRWGMCFLRHESLPHFNWYQLFKSGVFLSQVLTFGSWT